MYKTKSFFYLFSLLLLLTIFYNTISCYKVVPEPKYKPEINIKQGTINIPNGTGNYNYGNILADGNEGSTSEYILFEIENLGEADLLISSVIIKFQDKKRRNGKGFLCVLQSMPSGCCK